jgi:hypothetical protein
MQWSEDSSDHFIVFYKFSNKAFIDAIEPCILADNAHPNSKNYMLISY